MADFPHTLWARAASLAAEHRGCATRRQLLAYGLTSDSLGTAVRDGRVFRPHHGVYTLGRAPSTPHERAMAAVLSCGPRALVSHRWALWLHGLRRYAPAGPVDVSVPQRSGRTDVHLRRARVARPDRQQDIPCTSPVRTLLDCAPLLTDKQLRRAVNQAQIEHLVTADSLRGALARANGHATRRRLRNLLR